MSNTSALDAELNMPMPAPEVAADDDRPQIDWAALRKNPVFIASAAVAIGLLLAFSGLIRIIVSSDGPDSWFGPDSLFSHGPLIPLMAGYVVWARWDRIKDTPVKGTWWPLIFLIPILFLTFIGTLSSMKLELSALFIVAAFLCVWIVAGGRWMFKTAPAVLYLAFCLPLFWIDVVNRFTLPMQKLSTGMAMDLLKVFGLDPIQDGPTRILLNNYPLDVAAPCSGAKLTLALAAFTIFFILIGSGKLWQNIALVAIVLPFTLFINGMRIAMIGMVGNYFGPEAGHQFHDYGGYVSLVVCFILLRYITKLLGFKT